MDNSGRIGLSVILLGLVIAASLAAWGFMLVWHFTREREPSAPPVISESAAPTGGDAADDGEDADGEDGDGEDADGEDGDGDDFDLPTAPEMPSDVMELAISEAFPDIYRQLNAIAANYDAVAVSLAAYDGETGEFFTYEYGYADAEAKRYADAGTKFYSASLSKLVTAICVMSLVDGEYIKLDADVATYLGYEFRNPNFPDVPITTRMLLQHTSSVFDSGAFQVSRDRGSSESVRYLIERGSSFRRNKPGSNFEYTNFGYAVLGSICERVSGKSLDTLAREAIFEPLGIDAAYVPRKLRDSENIAVIYDGTHAVSRSLQTQLAVEQSDSLGHDLHLAAGSLTISSLDYAKILAMLGNGGVYQDERVLSEKSISEMHKANVEGAGFMQGFATRRSEPGLAWDGGNYWHTGSSYGVFSQYVYDFSRNIGVVVITSGASVNRLDNGMFDACTELSLVALNVIGSREEQIGDERAVG